MKKLVDLHTCLLDKAEPSVFCDFQSQLEILNMSVRMKESAHDRLKDSVHQRKELLSFVEQLQGTFRSTLSLNVPVELGKSLENLAKSIQLGSRYVLMLSEALCVGDAP